MNFSTYILLFSLAFCVCNILNDEVKVKRYYKEHYKALHAEKAAAVFQYKANCRTAELPDCAKLHALFTDRSEQQMKSEAMAFARAKINTNRYTLVVSSAVVCIIGLAYKMMFQLHVLSTALWWVRFNLSDPDLPTKRAGAKEE